MSDHLPECPLNNIDIHGLCMCPELRACEQRVLSVAGPHNYSRGRKDGYANGVQAARDAVAALLGWQHGIAMTAITKADALAAIDALREEKP